ncbi:hypothetical protein VNO80_28495 [Phaseolus coccineus]|uniref:Uncharacterized protein n=1 Tax=Phaseolus coccineus TaxID=3886 RepID=A0AAN9L9P6_PHACN
MRTSPGRERHAGIARARDACGRRQEETSVGLQEEETSVGLQEEETSVGLQEEETSVVFQRETSVVLQDGSSVDCHRASGHRRKAPSSKSKTSDDCHRAFGKVLYKVYRFERLGRVRASFTFGGLELEVRFHADPVLFEMLGRRSRGFLLSFWGSDVEMRSVYYCVMRMAEGTFQPFSMTAYPAFWFYGCFLKTCDDRVIFTREQMTLQEVEIAGLIGDRLPDRRSPARSNGGRNSSSNPKKLVLKRNAENAAVMKNPKGEGMYIREKGEEGEKKKVGEVNVDVSNPRPCDTGL